MFDYKNKNLNRRREFDYLLSKTLSIFKYGGLPETIPQRELERQLQTKGYAFITKVKGKLYSFNGGLGGIPDPYGNPTQIVIANPALDYNATLDIKKDGVLIRNDEMMSGLTHLLEKYIYMMTENEISMVVNSFNARMPILISAGDDNTRESAEHYIRNIVNGETGVIAENRLFEGINVQAGQSAQYTQMIEYHQYLKASLFNELGLEMNYNMKRERLTEDEVNMTDIIYPLIDNMMKMRLMAIEEMNKMFDLEVEIGFDSIWAKHQPDEAFDEDAFIDELGMYLDEVFSAPTPAPAPSDEMARFEQLANQSSEEELQAVLDELLLIQAEEENTSGDTSTPSVTDSVGSDTNADQHDRGESETRESDASPGSSGGDRGDDTESRVDNTGPTTESTEPVSGTDAPTDNSNSVNIYLDTRTEHDAEPDNSKPSNESSEPVSESDAPDGMESDGGDIEQTGTTHEESSGHDVRENGDGDTRDVRSGETSEGDGTGSDESLLEPSLDVSIELNLEGGTDEHIDVSEIPDIEEGTTEEHKGSQSDKSTDDDVEVNVDIGIEQVEEEADDES